MRKLNVIIISDFISLEIKTLLDQVLLEVGFSSSIEFKPYGMVVQHLVDGELCPDRWDFIIILIQIDRWLKTPISQGKTDLGQSLVLFLDALELALSRSVETHFVVFSCPPRDMFRNEVFSDATEHRLLEHLTGKTRINVLSEASLEGFARGSRAQLFSADGASDTDMIYSEWGFAALALTIGHQIRKVLRPPCKVVVVDCDNTLWKGLCGESQHVEVEEGHRVLQQALVQQSYAGKLICLCSKNNEEDVLRVFREQPEMVLRLENITAQMINWNPKTENILQLGLSLNLGLDSFLFIDDDLFECESVRLTLPEVEVLKLPEHSSAFQSVITKTSHFSQLSTTEEDRSRTEFYRGDVFRKRFLDVSSPLIEVLDLLELKVVIQPFEDCDTDRVSQLFNRTTQFNLNSSTVTLRKLKDPAFRQIIETVRVSDRFGDYGLVGAFATERDEQALCVRHLLLSCRALGRGVEKEIYRHIRLKALSLGVRSIVFDFSPTRRNAPIREFLDHLVRENRYAVSFPKADFRSGMG